MSQRLSAQDFKRLRAGLPQAAKKPKYGNQKVSAFDVDGKAITFDSKREAKRWSQLLLRLKAGEIDQLERQVPYLFAIGGEFLTYVGSNRKVKYLLDFRYVDKETDELVHEDVKGYATPEYRLKQSLMLLFHGIEVLEV